MRFFIHFVTTLTVCLSMSLAAAQDKVVVIPLNSTHDGVLTIPAPAFQPFTGDQQFANHGRYLFHYGGSSNLYLAPVYLPQNSTVTKLTFHFYDNEQLAVAIAKLQRTEFGKMNYVDMAYVDSGWYGYGPVSDDTIEYATIDNRKYGYWVTLTLPDHDFADVGAVSVIIDYH